ncbi:Gene transfer agent-like protein [Polymorphum gilvum SL003B-26A1]|uniref:Gene transfer agent-like protein n=2 Tax=Polymorphum TaxID=991903 RepID=F2J6H4_POLGS|nr:Gene transfer agent-like protein [Polymorphum gilvum SL003B-26A1]
MLDGREWTLVLTLGALAELEDAYACADLQALVERFAGGRLSARDMVRLIGAGLRGAGNVVTDDQVASMTAPGGAPGFAAIVADLLRVTFSDADDDGGDDGEDEVAETGANPPPPRG